MLDGRWMAGALENTRSKTAPSSYNAAREPHWKDLSARYAQAAGIAQKYGFDDSPFSREAQSFPRFKVAVLLTGPENSGKSALLNALMGESLLHASLTSQRALPIELVYGRNAPVFLTNEGSANSAMEEQGETLLDTPKAVQIRLSCKSAFLRELNRLRIVELPAVSGALLSPLKPGRFDAQSYACILAFSADDPVLGAEMVSVLDSLRLQNIPVQVLLTKCDKVTSEEQNAVKRYLTREITSILHVREVEIGCVRTFPDRDVGAARKCFQNIQRGAEAAGHSYYTMRLTGLCAPLLSYLRSRAQLAAFVSPNAAANEVESRLQSLSERFQSCENHARGQLEDLRQKLPAHINGLLLESCGVLETYYLRNAADVREARELMRMILTSILVGFYEPVFCEWENALGLPRETQDFLAETSSQTLPGYDPQITRDGLQIPERVPCARSALSAALEQFAREYYNFFRILEAYRPRRKIRPAKLAQTVRNDLLPPLCQLLGECITSGVHMRERRLKRKARMMLSEQGRSLERAAQEIRRLGEQEAGQAQMLTQDMNHDAAALEAFCLNQTGGERP